MTTRFIDNRDGNTLANAISDALANPREVRDANVPEELRIATAFFSPAGFRHVARHLDGVTRVRLMLGADPTPEAQVPRRRLDESDARFEQRLLKTGLDQLQRGLREERDHMPFSPSSSRSVRQLLDILQSGRMEVRLYQEAFLHAKAYLIGSNESGSYDDNGLIVGSSNLTANGMTRNLELNLGRHADPVYGEAARWFEELWEDAEEFDLASIYELPFADWSPWDVFLRVLYQLYGDEVLEEQQASGELRLTSFQEHGVARAIRLIDDMGGAIVADEVGLGKTFVAGEILRRYVDRRQRALLVCPAALRDGTWKKFLIKHQMGVECLSFEQLGRDLQLRDARRPLADQQHIERPLGEYQLIIVDEAHNYRNPDSAYRAGALRTLLFGKSRDVLLLTATPVNNSLWDLFHLIRFFMRQDAALADRGILSIRERFDEAMRTDPSNLSPDVLYPVIDATTVKRTRAFVKKHYQHDTIPGPDGRPVPIIFPTPKAISVRYNVDDAMPGFYDEVEAALDPDAPGRSLRFARYNLEKHRRGVSEDDEEHIDKMSRAQATSGLLRSALLKRFESSTWAFLQTTRKMLSEHDAFLDALGQGRVLTTAFMKEMADDEEATLEQLLADSDQSLPATSFQISDLREEVQRDREILAGLVATAEKITPSDSPKLAALRTELLSILQEAEEEAIDAVDEVQKRKVLIFSFFADTVGWIVDYLRVEFDNSPQFAKYRGRLTVASGSDEVNEVSRQEAVHGFAPISSEAPPGQDEDLYDILIATDVLAEGVNLQQCRHIINFDMPWNPMRLVQRHGRVDRIGSKHNKVFLRTIFPADRLDAMLGLEERILRKLAMAAASVGVQQPIEHAPGGDQVFAETREEIEKLLAEDNGLYERGGTAGAAQTGEEYRQTLRKALAADPERIKGLPWKAGSQLRKGKVSGVFFCTKIDDRTFLRFVAADANWQPSSESGSIVGEAGTCLRLIECEDVDERAGVDWPEERVYPFWDVAREDIWKQWMHQTDPVNLQPKVRPLNLKVAEYVRNNPIVDFEEALVSKALDILESPWPRREEYMLRGWFESEDAAGSEKARELVEKIIDTGIEPYRQAPLLPPIQQEDVELICWMAVIAEA